MAAGASTERSRAPRSTGSLNQLENDMAYTLPPLPYPTNALEPHIDAQTMEIHHGKHHQAYVTNLNAALEKAPELRSRSGISPPPRRTCRSR